MTRLLIVIAALATATTTTTATAAELVPTRSSWRSTEIDGGVVLNPVTSLAPFENGVLVGHGFSNIGAVMIAADGSASQVLDVAGEAPGHVDRPRALDVSRDGSLLALIGGIGGQGVVRRPVRPPFDHVAAIRSLDDPEGMPQGFGLRLVDGAVIRHTGVQPATDYDALLVRLVRHDLGGAAPVVLHEEFESPNRQILGALAWVWDAEPDGSVYLSDDYESGSIVALGPDGSVRFRVDVPVEILRFDEDSVEQQKRQRDSMRGKVPEAVLPVVRETRRAIAHLSVRADEGRAFVVSSAGLGRGRDAVEQVSWWVVDTGTGEVLGQQRLDLPDGAWWVRTIEWFGDRIYVAAEDASRAGEPEVLCLERVGHGDR